MKRKCTYLVQLFAILFLMLNSCHSISKKKSIEGLPEPIYNYLIKEDEPPPPPLTPSEEKDPNKTAIRDRYLQLSSNWIKSDIYCHQAIDYYKKKELKLAIKYFDSAVLLQPTNYNAVYNRALIKFRLGDFDGGCSDINNSILLGKKEAASIKQNYCDN